MKPTGRPRAGVTVKCEICGKERYCPQSRVRRFCSRDCYAKAATINAPTCSVEGCDKPVQARNLCSKHYWRWETHGDPAVTTMRPRGTGGYNSGGYLRVTVNGKQRMEHVVIAEAALGRPLPHGAIVHHANGNPADNRPENLVICPSEAYHRLLHKRMRALA